MEATFLQVKSLDAQVLHFMECFAGPFETVKELLLIDLRPGCAAVTILAPHCLRHTADANPRPPASRRGETPGQVRLRVLANLSDRRRALSRGCRFVANLFVISTWVRKKKAPRKLDVHRRPSRLGCGGVI